MIVIVCCGVGIIATDPFGFLILARTLGHSGTLGEGQWYARRGTIVR